MNLTKTLQQHKLWLYTVGKKGTRADLRGADLRGAYLRGAYLEGADLRYTYLRDADLPIWKLATVKSFDGAIIGKGVTLSLSQKKILPPQECTAQRHLVCSAPASRAAAPGCAS